MNLVPGVTGLDITVQNHAHNTFFNRGLLADFELRLRRNGVSRFNVRVAASTL
jgi:hypothetical protein